MASAVLGPSAPPEAHARKLLLSYLSPLQRQMLRRAGFFYVRGGDQRYYALVGGAVVVALGDDGVPFRSHEIWPYLHGEHLPHSDDLLAQKLLLEANPKLFHSTACGWTYFGYNGDAKAGERNRQRYFAAFVRECERSHPHRRRWPQLGDLFRR